MNKVFVAGFQALLIVPVTVLAIGMTAKVSFGQGNQSQLYNPIPLTHSNELTDTLSEEDIPTGQGGFARDYTLPLKKGDNLVIDLSSESFDTIITLLAPNGVTLVENDDGPDGSSNSLLFTRINEEGTYIIRVRSFGETGVGEFKLKVTKLQPLK